MDLTKKMRGVIADIIRGNYSFFKFIIALCISTCSPTSLDVVIGRINSSSSSSCISSSLPTFKKKFLTDVARYY